MTAAASTTDCAASHIQERMDWVVCPWRRARHHGHSQGYETILAPRAHTPAARHARRGCRRGPHPARRGPCRTTGPHRRTVDCGLHRRRGHRDRRGRRGSDKPQWSSVDIVGNCRRRSRGGLGPGRPAVAGPAPQAHHAAGPGLDRRHRGTLAGDHADAESGQDAGGQAAARDRPPWPVGGGQACTSRAPRRRSSGSASPANRPRRPGVPWRSSWLPRDLRPGPPGRRHCHRRADARQACPAPRRRPGPVAVPCHAEGPGHARRQGHRPK
jgi:hypothetical protein